MPGIAALIAAGGATADAVESLPELFARYNAAVWPGHLVAYGLVAGVLALIVWRPGLTTDRAAAGLLAAQWLWLGLVFHGMYATRLDPTLGAVYAALFVVQAALFVRAGLLRRELAFTVGHGVTGILGWLAIGYALVAYPLLGIALGHGYPEAPLFGMAPCPTTIVTFGLLLLARAPVPRHLLTIPFLWAVLGPLGAVPQGMVEDLGLLVVGVVAVAVLLVRDRRRSPLRPVPA